MEGGVEGEDSFVEYISKGYYANIGESFKKELLKLSNNHNIVIIYPIPEVGWKFPQILLNSLKTSLNKHILKQNYISTSFDVYSKRTEDSFKLLDSIKNENIYRVYPHKLFCNNIQNNRCITHDDKNIFYSDNNHPSLQGAEMINNLIIKEIEKIELKSN